MANKVKYNLKNVHYAMQSTDDSGNITFETPVKIPGAVSLSLDPEGDLIKFYADGYVYYTVNGNTGYSGDLEMALIPDDFKVSALGEVKDSTSGLQYETANAVFKNFALMFEFDGDSSSTRHVLYNCVASRPNLSGKTKEDSIEVQTETLTLNAYAMESGLVKGKAESGDSAYTDFFSAVVVPTVA